MNEKQTFLNLRMKNRFLIKYINQNSTFIKVIIITKE